MNLLKKKQLKQNELNEAEKPKYTITYILNKSYNIVHNVIYSTKTDKRNESRSMKCFVGCVWIIELIDSIVYLSNTFRSSSIFKQINLQSNELTLKN